MKLKIRPFAEEDLDRILEISLQAFAPIHDSFRRVLGADVFDRVYPDWRTSNQEYVRGLCEGQQKKRVLVVEEDGRAIGFVSYFVKPERKSGEIGINAIHPDYQNRGIGTMMYEHVLEIMEGHGIELVEVGTGGDLSHRAARRAYEKCGFVSLPLVRYYKAL